ncbi:Arylsulphatase [Aureobasidium sp. EXF-10728]|nr:Arylsulphatase [Aureobasidium sp. EXF-10728]
MRLAPIAAACASVIGVSAQQQVLGQQSSPPNIVFVLTDDQDVHLSSLEYMPLVKKHLIDKGTYYDKHYCTTAVCCPARVTLMTGKAAHNTNITDVNPPYGGYPKFVKQGFNSAYLPVWLQEAGYNVYYTGKLFNAHNVDNYNTPYPAGFTSHDFLLDPYTYNYMNSSFQHNTDPPQSHEGEYVTDVLAQKAYGLLDEAVEAKKPFFLMIAPSAPHADIQNNSGLLTFDAPVSAPRHAHLFKDIKVPRTANFNPEVPSGANWIRLLERQNTTNVDWNDHFYRQRLRALQAVDELVDTLFSRLESHGLLNNTYIIYSSDNGFHIGNHRMQPGKSTGCEEDINIPLIIRGPNVPINQSTQLVTSHTDIAATIFSLLDIPLREDFDGAPIPVTHRTIEAEENKRREHVQIEYWGFAGGEGIYDRRLHQNNTFKGIRTVAEGYNLYYQVWCTNEHELYDMRSDQGQMHNLLEGDAKVDSVSGYSLEKVVQRLDALLMVQKSCRGKDCREPWRSLHPDGSVQSLRDAMAERYDTFYEGQVKVQWDYCHNGYVPEAEGPMFGDEGVAFSDEGFMWPDWV